MEWAKIAALAERGANKKYFALQTNSCSTEITL